MLFGSLFLAVSLLLPLAPQVVLAADQSKCFSGSIQIQKHLTVSVLKKRFPLPEGKAGRDALKHSKHLCLCGDLGTEDIQVFIDQGAVGDPDWKAAIDKLKPFSKNNDALYPAIRDWYENDNHNSDVKCEKPGPNGNAVCVAGQCGQVCTNSFELIVNKNGITKCSCPASKPNLCNGACQAAPCPKPSAVKRSTPYTRAEIACSRKDGGGYKWCETLGQAHGNQNTLTPGFECLNVLSGLESCGGCPSLATSSHGPHPALQPLDANTIANDILLSSSDVGRDCTAIPHVDSVACVLGSCLVQSCSSGWNVSGNGEACVKQDPQSASL